MTDEWTVHGETTLYDSPWVRLHLADVETPSGRRHEHHLVRTPTDGAGAIVIDDRGRILLIRRYRFIVDAWGWELPAGRVDPGEAPETAAAREVTEETGWEPADLTHLVTLHTTPGLADQTSHVYLARRARKVAEPTDPDEAAVIRWVALADVRSLLASGEIHDAFTMCGLLWFLTFGDPAGA